VLFFTTVIMQSVLSSSSEFHRNGEDGNILGKNNIWSPSFYFVPNNDHTIPHSDAQEDQTYDDLVRPFFHELQSALRHYREMADRIIRQLSISHEVALRTEHFLFPHHHSRIIAKCNDLHASWNTKLPNRQGCLSTTVMY
jgi:hypothetical protein